VLVARERDGAAGESRAGLGGAVVALLPLYAERTRLGGRRLRLMGDDIVGSDYVGVVARPEDEPRAARAFAAHLAALPVDEVRLDGLLAADPLGRALAGAATIAPRHACPHIALRGGFEAYLAARPEGAGEQWTRRLRWLARRPGFAVVEHADPDAVAAAMDVLFELHRRRWALDGGSQAIDGAPVESLHRDAAAGLARRGWARLWLLTVCGAPRAALYGFRHGRRFAFYQAGHDPAWRPRSVGTVLLGAVIARCFDEGLEEFDFLRGDEPYKWRWANGGRATVAVTLTGPGARAWLGSTGNEAWARVREAVKSTLPPATLEGLRRARRGLGRSS
jgi:CelD/BcsL family acetyltransferase involved in cellulose biosynthesis